MKKEVKEILHGRAKHRKDGVYNHKGWRWVVKDNSFIAYSDSDGKAFEENGECIGRIPKCSIKRGLNQWLKNQKK